jgi:phosphoribosyl 1,2-cyclic phosphodiesterase
VRLTVWGCRGSVPTPGPETVRYGGNTSCVEVRFEDGTVIVLDAGTGIRELGVELLRRGVERINLCLTHLHLDHLEGLRFFGPLWEDEIVIDIWGPPSPVSHLQDRIARAFSPPLFPVELGDVPAQVTFRDIPRRPWTIGGARLVAEAVAHPGPTVGYRIENASGVVAYIPDHEPALTGSLATREREWISGGAVAADADVLLHDAQYFEDEYEERVGWGHSSVDDAVAFTRAVGARRLVLFHHEPRHDDELLERLEARARALVNGGGPQPTLAREGMVIEIP